MGRSQCSEKVGLKKGPWTPEEDQKLLAYIERHGHGSWRALPSKAGLQRCGKSCRLRWTNYLRPDIKRGKFSLQEEQTIIQLHAFLGNRWSAIATHLPKRTDNEIKNYWNTHLKKRLTKMGIDPMTHKPKNNALGSAQPKDTANLNHMAQWESARLEAEARLVRESKWVISTPYHPPPPIGSISSSQPALITKAAASLSVPLKQPIVPPPCLDILKAWQRVWTNSSNTLLNSNNIGTLESPTSILNFSDNVFTVPSNSFKVGQNSKARGEIAITKENHVQRNLHEIGAFPVDITCVADSLGLPSFMESFPHEDLLSEHDAEAFNITHELYDNLGSCSNGNLEDNKKYWSNTIL